MVLFVDSKSSDLRRRGAAGERGNADVVRVLGQSARSLAAGRPHRAPTDPPIRVLVVDPHSLVRLGLISLFAKARHTQVVGEASSTEEAVAQARELAPDVVVLDADVADRSAVDGSRRMRADNPRVQIVLLSSVVDPSQVVAAIEAGARGYLLKRTEPDRIVDAVAVVAADGVYISQEVAGAVMDWFRTGQPGMDPVERLSQRELRILFLIVEGKTNRTIAAELGLSEYTVKTYVSSALRKLGLSSRAQAAAYIVRHRDRIKSQTNSNG